MPRLESGGVVDPAARDKYLLKVTAGPSRDTSTHRIVPVNGPDAHVTENDLMSVWLKVKIKDYHGLPRNSPSTSDYFNHPLHTSDRYSVGFSFVPKKDISGQDLVTGFDFDHSIKDRLPPGFRYAMKIVTTILDPGIYSDPYSDNPYLYGPALSSFFAFRIGELISEIPAEEQLATFENDFQGVIEEGADGSGQRIRADQQIPSKTSKRRKNFLSPKNLENFTFEAGRMYQADFFNPYLDFANFALRIPGFSISIVRYIDDKTHQLRYVMKNRRTEEVMFCVIFNLLFGKELEETLSSEQGQQLSTHIPSKLAEDERPYTPERGRPATSSSNETPTPSSRSSSVPSDIEDLERQSRQATTSTLASSIYSGFAALGFGRTASSSESSSASTSPERPKKSLNQKVDEIEGEKIEEYLKTKQSTAT